MHRRHLQLAALFAVALGCSSGCIVDGSEGLDEDGEFSADAVGGVKKPGPGELGFGRSVAELRKSVPITSNAKWRVVYSVALDDLTLEERIAVRGEVQMTTCQASDLQGTPCKRITPFDPSFKAKIVLGTSPTDADGPNLSKTVDVTCTHFKHHCALAIPEGIEGKLSGKKFVNLVVAATGSNPNGSDIMIVDQTHGGLYVTRMGGGVDLTGPTVRGRDVSPSSMRLNHANTEKRDEHVVLQAEVKNAKPREVLDFDALIEAVTRGSGPKPAGCQGAREPLISHQIIISTKQNDPSGSRIATGTEKNGSNCRLNDRCNYRKSGAMQLPKDVPSTVYVSVVSMGGRSCSAPNDEWKLGSDSFLEVHRRD